MSDSNSIFCRRCGLKQFGRARCLRCGVNLDQPNLPTMIHALRTEMRAAFDALRTEIADPAAEAKRLEELSAHLGLHLRPVPGIVFPDPLPTLAETEETLIRIAMTHTRGDRLKAAKVLGIGKTTMYRKCKELGL